jgi:hypothetical protein
MTDNYISIVTLVSQHFGSFYPALPNTCEALVAMHTIVTHSKDLPEDIFKAGAQFVLRILCLLSSLLQSVSTSVLSILRYQTLARPFLLQFTPYLHIARTCLRTSLKQVHSLSSDSSLVVTFSVSQSALRFFLSCATKPLRGPSCNAQHVYT